mgnify:FL=1
MMMLKFRKAGLNIKTSAPSNTIDHALKHVQTTAVTSSNAEVYAIARFLRSAGYTAIIKTLGE